MKYPCKWTFAPTEMNTMCEKLLQEFLCMDIHEPARMTLSGWQASVAVASNKKTCFINHLITYNY